jgi:VWFA-related protein
MGAMLRLTLIALMTVPLLGGQAGPANRAQRIFVVAVKTVGATIFRSCPPSGMNLKNPTPGIRMPAFRAPELFPADGIAIPEGVLDDGIRRRIEKGFQGIKKFAVVGSLEDADLVFFVEASFNSWVESITSDGKGPSPPTFGKDGVTFPPAAARGAYISVGGDEKPNIMPRAIAIAVDVESYRRNSEDGAALLKAALWTGMARGVNNRSVLPESLVGRFIRGQKPGRGEEICPDTQPRHALPGWIAASERTPALQLAQAALSRTPDTGAVQTTFKVDVEFVTVPVVVTDGKGMTVPDLRASDFHIFEDAVEQKLDRILPETEPFNVGLLLDTSQSTQINFEEIQRGALAFAGMLRPVDRLLVASFNSRVFVDSEFTTDRDQLIQAISHVRPGGNTRLYDAVELAMTQRLRFVPGRKAIILFTDGVDNASSLADEKATIARIEKSDVPVYVIQFDTKGASPRLPMGWRPDESSKRNATRESEYARAAQYLRQLADGSGGTLSLAENSYAVGMAFSQIGRELQHQYALCYYPANRARDGAFRRIQVTTSRAGLQVRARSGYRVGLDTPTKKQP